MKLKLVYIIVAIVVLFTGGYFLYPELTPGIRQCPDVWIQNDMPGITSSSQWPRQYFIIDGERKEIKDYNINWIKLHCSVKVDHVS